MPSPGTIFILEDNPERLAELVAVARELLPNHPVAVFDDCDSAVRWLEAHQHEVSLISLDHDLDSVTRPDEPTPIDHGCGRGVADFLATRPATCPIVVHSANEVAGSGMFFELKRAGWPVWRVRPRDHHDWVKRDWARTLVALAEAGWI